MREHLRLPPYGRLAALVLSGPDPERLEETARGIAAAAPLAEGVEVFGPADAPLAVIRGRWRKRFLVQADRKVDVSAYMRAWMARVKIPAAIRASVDIEPYSFL